MITIFTDGSSRGNPGPGGWGVAIIYGSNVTELGGREYHTTNNRMELTAAIEGLIFVSRLAEASEKIEGGGVRVNSDSSYVINGITKWVYGWVKKKWVTSQKEEVMNRDLWERLMMVVSDVEKKSEVKSGMESGAKITWNYVGGHRGIAGNERCDEIATSFADGNPVKLFSGSLEEYPLKDILNFSKNAENNAENVENADAFTEKSGSQSKSSLRSQAKATAYSYVSSVDGVIKTHKTWRECESRVKGVRGARYKKARNVVDEAAIIKNLEKI